MKVINCTLVSLMVCLFAASGFSQQPKDFYKTGLAFAKAGNHMDAVDQFTRALELDPDYVSAYIQRAVSYEAAGDLNKAADDLRRALVFEQKEPELFYVAARVNFALGNYKESLELAHKSVLLDKKNESAYRLLARTQLAMEDYSTALVTINKALALKANPANHFYRALIVGKMKNYIQAEQDYSKAIAKNNLYTEAYLELAGLRLLLGKPEEAMEGCNTVLAYEPGNMEAYLIRGRIYASLKEYPSAIDDASKILSHDPDDASVLLIRGTYYQEFTQHQNAINDFTRVMLITGKNPDAIFKRAFSYEQIGDFKSAIKDYETLTSLSGNEQEARQHLGEAQKRLYELNRESVAPIITLLEPQVYGESNLKFARDKNTVTVRGKIKDDSDIREVYVNSFAARFFKTGESFEFTVDLDISSSDFVTITARDFYENRGEIRYSIIRTETDPPFISILAPYASDNGEIYLDTENDELYIEGSIKDESMIQSILIDSVTASFRLDGLNPRFSATINVSNKNRFNVTATDVYGNTVTQAFVLNREGVSLLEANPMGRTWVIFIENSNYDIFPSLDGPARDVTLMRSALSKYEIHKVIYKQDMSKKEMERFFSIELRDLLRSNKVNALMIWYAGHGKFIHETGYWIPVDAIRDDEFTYYNLNALRASLQSYSGYITHNLVVTDACESGPAFCQVMREIPSERNCNDWEAVRFKSSQVFSSAGYELAVDNSQFTKTFANTLSNNPEACIPIESIVNKVAPAVTRNRMQTPKFGRIAGLEDEDGTFFFIAKK